MFRTEILGIEWDGVWAMAEIAHLVVDDILWTPSHWFALLRKETHE
jgi:hypothetical protein